MTESSRNDDATAPCPPWWRFPLVWMVIGLAFYFLYGKKHSKIGAPHPPEMPEGISLTK